MNIIHLVLRKGNEQVEQTYQEMFLLKMTKCINIVEPCCAVNPSSIKERFANKLNCINYKAEAGKQNPIF